MLLEVEYRRPLPPELQRQWRASRVAKKPYKRLYPWRQMKEIGDCFDAEVSKDSGMYALAANHGIRTKMKLTREGPHRGWRRVTRIA